VRGYKGLPVRQPVGIAYLSAGSAPGGKLTISDRGRLVLEIENAADKLQ
jgi:hypothetical protein